MKYYLFLSFSILCFSLFSQDASMDAPLDRFAIFRPSQQDLKVEDFFENYFIEMGLTKADEFVIIKEKEGLNNFSHIRYQQVHGGIPVFGVSYILHTKDGYITSANGSFLPAIDLELTPILSAEQALSLAMSDIAAEEYEWQADAKKAAPVPELNIINQQLTKFNGNYNLVYRFELRSHDPIAAYEYYIDAHSGIILHKLDLHEGHGVPGSGKTRYYGEQTFIVDSIAPDEFILRDPTRCANGINILNDGKGNFTSTTSYFDLENEDQNEVAVDAHYLTAKFYDLLRDNFDWLGLDDEDRSMNICVHARGGTNLVNAYWDGTYAWFGNGDCNHGPLVTAEVVAHEFMHGIVDHTSRLIYSEESGAINESIADVMGQYLEYMIDEDNFSWDLGNSFAISEFSEPLRVMDDPTSIGYPEYYRGPNWQDGANVHINSSIGNLFYVMLADGRSGTNLDGDEYNVTGIGVVEAAQFIFHTNRHYLTESSNYNAYYEACLLAAEEFYAGDPDMLHNIQEAWKAVGVPANIITTDGFDLAINTSGRTIRTCDWGEYLPLTFTVTNKGTVLYSALDSLEVVVGNISDETRILLTTDILPGESMTFDVDSFLMIDKNFLFVNYVLDIDDVVSENNSASDLIQAEEFVENNISVIARSPEAECFAETFDIDVSVTNESCTSLPMGTGMDIVRTDENNSVILLDSIELLVDLTPGGSQAYTKVIAVDASQELLYRVKVNLEGDNDTSDNSGGFLLRYIETISGEYFNGFDSEADLNAELFIQTNRSFFNLGVLNSDNMSNSAFYTTGDTETAGPLCPESEKNWDFDLDFSSPISATLSTCLDLESMESPLLTFDLTQYRNNVMENASQESSSTQLTLSGENIQESYIYIQPEAETVNQRIQLPANFKGFLDMKFLTQTGPESGNELTFDAVLMDNFTITGSVNTDNLTTEEVTIEVYPNPAGDVLYISYTEDILSYQIFDITGKLMRSMRKNNNLKTIDLGDIESGYYLLKLQTKSNKNLVKKFIRL